MHQLACRTRAPSNSGRSTPDPTGEKSMSNSQASRTATAEQRLNELGIQLPAPPQPFGAYVEAVQAGHLLFLTGMLPTAGREAKFIGRVGAEFDAEAARNAAYLARSEER